MPHLESGPYSTPALPLKAPVTNCVIVTILYVTSSDLDHQKSRAQARAPINVSILQTEYGYQTDPKLTVFLSLQTRDVHTSIRNPRLAASGDVFFTERKTDLLHRNRKLRRMLKRAPIVMLYWSRGKSLRWTYHGPDPTTHHAAWGLKQ
jgi:hypothetical protein